MGEHILVIMKRNIAIYLSSHSNLPDSYRQAVSEVGKWMGQAGHTLVYGGARKGLMEVLAQTVKGYGGRVFGVVPQILVDRNCVSDHIDVIFHCTDLSDRKAVMMRESEVLLAMPGGIGTLDEVFTALAANTIGLQRKHVILYDVDGCWDRLMEMLCQMKEVSLVSEESLSFLHVVNSVDLLQETIDKVS